METAEERFPLVVGKASEIETCLRGVRANRFGGLHRGGPDLRPYLVSLTEKFGLPTDEESIGFFGVRESSVGNRQQSSGDERVAEN